MIQRLPARILARVPEPRYITDDANNSQTPFFRSNWWNIDMKMPPNTKTQLSKLKRFRSDERDYKAENYIVN